MELRIAGFVTSVGEVLREDGRAVQELLFDLGLRYLVLPLARHDFFSALFGNGLFIH